MSTATLPDVPTATTEALAPHEPDLASVFYGPAKETTVTPQANKPVSTPATEPGASDAPNAPSASTEQVNPPSQNGPEAKPEKPEPAHEKGAAATATRLGREVASIKREMQALAEENKVLKAKLDGTYEEPAQPTAQDLELRAEFRGRETASRAIAEAQFGKSVVQEKIYDDESPYKQLVAEKPWLHVQVARHPQPTVEALRVLEEQSFKAKYGDDPTKWASAIEAELRPKLMDELKQLTAQPVTGAPVPTVTEARGSGGPTKAKSLEDLFYGSPKKG